MQNKSHPKLCIKTDRQTHTDSHAYAFTHRQTHLIFIEFPCISHCIHVAIFFFFIYPLLTIFGTNFEGVNTSCLNSFLFVLFCYLFFCSYTIFLIVQFNLMFLIDIYHFTKGFVEQQMLFPGKIDIPKRDYILVQLFDLIVLVAAVSYVSCICDSLLT